jgi:hypothetical protein
MKKNLLIICAFILALQLNLVIPETVVADNDSGAATAENKAESNEQEDPLTDPAELEFNQKLDQLIPSQSSLFDRSKRLDADGNGIISVEERIRLADGDLEQGLAPRLLRILIGFSGVALFCFFTYIGVRLLLSRGNEETYTNTKNIAVQVLVGSVLITASFGIVLGVIRFFNAL